MTDLIGQSLLDRYFVREHIGAGGMADVYLAWDNQRTTEMAIKVLRRDLARDDRFYKRFKREAELLRELEHPNIARIYEFDKSGDIVFLVMEWIRGESLREKISAKNKPLSISDTITVLQPLSAALFYAHKKNVFHCDVKPANILLHEDKRIFLTDFGVARISTESLSGGTPPYMAPEQIRKDIVDARTDIYSLGITLYEMLSGGYVPYRGESHSSQGSTLKERIKWEHLHLPLPPLHTFNKKIPSALEGVIEKSLQKDPAHRYSDVMEFTQAFKRAAHNKASIGRDTIFTTQAEESTQYVQKTTQYVEKTKNTLIQGWKTFVSSTKNPKLYCRQGEYNNGSIEIPYEGLRMGRSSRNGLVFRSKSVSRMHAVVYKTEEGVFVRDENSSAGTYLNGNRIMDVTRLEHGDILQIGYDQVFEYRKR